MDEVELRPHCWMPIVLVSLCSVNQSLDVISINLLVVYRESVNLIGYITRRLSADSLQL